MSASVPSGLSAREAAERLARVGPNAIPEHRIPAWRAILMRFWAPVPWMLEAVIVLQLLLGRPDEAVVIALLLVLNALVAFVQERRAGNALGLLRRRLPVRARVRRDGAWTMLPAEELVPDDLVHLRAGDIVPADMHLLDGVLALDQSALTGESLPAEAAAGDTAYAGAIVQRGEATGTVTATGPRTFYGRTAELVQASRAPSHMQRTILAIVTRLAAFDAALAALVVAWALVHHLPVGDTLVFALMLLVASVPVALPATYTLATAVGGLTLAGAGVLVTRLAAVEEAAAMTTLVSDKTGTLTENRLRLAEVVPLGGADADTVLRAAAMASDEATQDPIDLAILAPARERHLLDGLPARRNFLPFDPATRRSEALYAGGAMPRVVKGAAGDVTALCRPGPVPAGLAEAGARLAADGARVLAVAGGAGEELALLGLVALADPPRADAAALIAALRALGVRVRMATGDAAETGRAIAARLGIGTRTATPAADGTLPPDADVYARVLPQDKHRLVATLQRGGEVVGMTGDGVNDAPALRQAELGVAVASATDVAKAAAGVVLTDPGLGGVLAVVRAGREVHRRMLTYTLNKVIKTFEIVVFLTILLLGEGRFAISPTLIVLLLFANDFLTMSIAGDRVTAAPRPQRWRVSRLTAAAGAFAVLALCFSLGGYMLVRTQTGLGPTAMQTVTFLILVFTNQASVYALRTDAAPWRPLPGRWMVVASVAGVAVVSLLAAAGWLMAPVPPALIGALLAGSLVYGVVMTLCKRAIFHLAALP